ncbi:ribosome recycling factor [Auriscalpium vulgare]|uniref:Ribosome recycling factor n=1 Tax=Auriscalpium vulgare TaxID=40419 RepID=A0ACB8RV97_9AGAM|nr:ribosome recycling factor [Auriscalpium vulgare]
MSTLRRTCRLSQGLLRSSVHPSTSCSAALTVHRTYASKHKHKGNQPVDPTPHSKRGPVSTASLTPGSAQALTNPASQEEYERAVSKMTAVVEWYRREAGQLDARASGRVTPQLLSPVRVTLTSEEAGETKVRLEEVATVGVRDGSVLVVTVFDTDNLKEVEDALYEAKLPGVVPQRLDERTIKIPIPKPTVDARTTLYQTAARQAEEARVQIRRQQQASVKKGKFAKHSVEIEEFQKLHDRQTAEIDAILTQLKKSSGAR